MKAWFLLLGLVCVGPAAAQPVAYAWRLECQNAKMFGPFGTPDACRNARTGVATTCETPTLQGTKGPAVPNPEFVRIADICQESLNGRGCDCVYTAYPAQRPAGHRTLGDLVRERLQQQQPTP